MCRNLSCDLLFHLLLMRRKLGCELLFHLLDQRNIRLRLLGLEMAKIFHTAESLKAIEQEGCRGKPRS